MPKNKGFVEIEIRSSHFSDFVKIFRVSKQTGVRVFDKNIKNGELFERDVSVENLDRVLEFETGARDFRLEKARVKFEEAKKEFADAKSKHSNIQDFLEIFSKLKQNLEV